MTTEGVGMTCNYSATFEYDLRPTQTTTGTITAGSAATCCARATRIAQKAQAPKRWRSMVVVLERVGVDTPETSVPASD